MCCEPTGRLKAATCLNGWNGPSPNTELRPTCAATTVRNFIAKGVQRWLTANAIKTIYIEPGSPWQNGFVESFHGRFRDECLNREQLWTLTEARVVIEDYRCQYNHHRPHSKLGYQSPNTSQLPKPFHLRLQSPFGLLTPKMDTPKQTT